MRKKLVTQLALASAVGIGVTLAAGTAGAVWCVSCHTMHNSQNGQPMRYGGIAEPAPVLLLDTCLGCHSGTNTATSLVPGNLPPKVMSVTGEPSYDAEGSTGNTLAGGDFWWVDAGEDAKGHNVVDFAIAEDGALHNKPPGGVAMGGQLQCAGTTGCHGNPTIAGSLSAMEGAHHTAHGTAPVNPMLTATTVGNSFRYLLGTKGGEDTDWQFTQSSTDHNQYVGLSRGYVDTADEDVASINGLCARCHAAFHNKVTAAETTGFYTAQDAFGIRNTTTNNWIRHPTDYSMNETAGKEYASYTVYKPEAPVGRLEANVTNTTDGTVTGAGYRIVLCVSCHRAHGSPYDDLLRWRYSDMNVGENVPNGCMNCHTYK